MESTVSAFVLVISTATCIAVFILLGVILARRHLKSEELGSAVTETWIRLGLDQAIARIEYHAHQIRGTHNTIEQMLRSPIERASFGELSLELILSDQLPGDFFAIREKCFDGMIPDAYIKSPEGLICIDSKFPLENYARMWSFRPEQSEHQEFLKQFLKDSEKHLKKVANDYIRPESGTATFAFVFIPSEAVYYVLATEGFEMLRRYVTQGVQVVSPLLLGHKLVLLKSGIRALRLNENAQEVLSILQTLSKRFETLQDAWRVFYATHLRNLSNKADEIDEAYQKLNKDFHKVATELSSEGTSPETKNVKSVALE